MDNAEQSPRPPSKGIFDTASLLGIPSPQTLCKTSILPNIVGVSPKKLTKTKSSDKESNHAKSEKCKSSNNLSSPVSGISTVSGNQSTKSSSKKSSEPVTEQIARLLSTTEKPKRKNKPKACKPDSAKNGKSTKTEKKQTKQPKEKKGKKSSSESDGHVESSSSTTSPESAGAVSSSSSDSSDDEEREKQQKQLARLKRQQQELRRKVQELKQASHESVHQKSEAHTKKSPTNSKNSLPSSGGLNHTLKPVPSPAHSSPLMPVPSKTMSPEAKSSICDLTVDEEQNLSFPLDLSMAKKKTFQMAGSNVSGANNNSSNKLSAVPKKRGRKPKAVPMPGNPPAAHSEKVRQIKRNSIKDISSLLMPPKMDLLPGHATNTSLLKSSNPESKSQYLLRSQWRRETRIRCFSRSGVRGEVAYYTPCGKKLRSYPEVVRYLVKNGITDISRDNFTFSTKVNVGEFLECISSGAGQDYVLLSENEVLARIEEARARKGRLGVQNRKSSAQHRAMEEEEQQRQWEQKQMQHHLEQQARSREAQESKLLRQAQREQALMAAREEKRLRAEESRKQKEQQRIMKQQEKFERMEQLRIEREIRAQQMLEDQEMKRQQAVFLREQERERRRQHMILVRALENRKKQEERERKREEILFEKRINREKKLEQRRIELDYLRELKKPVDDMMLKDLMPLPTLNRIPGVKLCGKAFADTLMVFEFLHNFGETLGFDVDSLPTLNTLQTALLNLDEKCEDELLSIVHHLLVCAIDDPGIQHCPEAATVLGQNLKDADITNSNVSEVLRLYFIAQDKRSPMLEWLQTKPFLSLNATQKAEVIAFLCDELLTSRLLTRQIDSNIENVNVLRKDKWLVEGDLRRYRSIQQRRALKARLSAMEENRDNPNCANMLSADIPDFSLTESKENTAGNEDSEAKEAAKSDKEKLEEMENELANESGNESDDTQAPGQISDGEDEDLHLSNDEINKKIEKLTKQLTLCSNKLTKAFYTIRGATFGMDRYHRRYWVLPKAGGVYVESMESSLRPEEQAKVLAEAKEPPVKKEEDTDSVKDESIAKEKCAEEKQDSSSEKTDMVDDKDVDSKMDTSVDEKAVNELDESKDVKPVIEEKEELCKVKVKLEENDDLEPDKECEMPEVDKCSIKKEEDIEMEEIIQIAPEPENAAPEKSATIDLKEEMDDDSIIIINSESKDNVVDNNNLKSAQDEEIKINPSKETEGKSTPEIVPSPIKRTWTPDKKPSNDNLGAPKLHGTSERQHAPNPSIPPDQNWLFNSPLFASILAGNMLFNGPLMPQRDMNGTYFNLPKNDSNNPFGPFLGLQPGMLSAEQIFKSLGEKPSNQKPWFSILPRMPCDESLLNSPQGSRNSAIHSPANICSPDVRSNSRVAHSSPTANPAPPPGHVASALSNLQMELMNGVVPPGFFLHPFLPPQFGPTYQSTPPSTCASHHSSFTSTVSHSSPMPDFNLNFNRPPPASTPNSIPTPSATPGPTSHGCATPTSRDTPSPCFTKRLLMEKMTQEYEAPQPIPPELQRGWWRITDPNQLKLVISALHHRGIREKMFQKQLQKHFTFACASCTQGQGRDTDLEITDMDKEISKCAGGAPDPDPEDFWYKDIALRVDMGILEQVENLEEKVDGSSMQVKCWKPPPKLSTEQPSKFVPSCEQYVHRTADEIYDAIKEKQLRKNAKKSSSRKKKPVKKEQEPEPSEVDPEKKPEEEGSEMIVDTEAAEPSEPVTEDLDKSTVEDSSKIESDIIALPNGKLNPVEEAKKRLLKVEASIERRYLRPPLGTRSTISSGGAPSNPVPTDTSEEENIPVGLVKWRNAVENCRTAAQLSMCLNFLETCTAWDKSIMRASCQFCHSGDNEEKLLLCDGCDKGYHTYCFKPVMETIPEGDWYCFECLNKATGDNVCVICGTKGKLIECETCPKTFHLNCLEPPLAKMPKGKWYCSGCNLTRPKKSKKSNANKEKETPKEKETKETAEKTPKKAESTSTSKSKSSEKKKKEEKKKEPEPVGNVDLAPCSTILEEMQKHEDAWPFLTPVNTKQFPTYRKVIKKPMDMQTMKNKLEAGQYKCREDFANDARLIFDNCETFNEDESPVGQAGHSMRAFFESRWSELCST
ncbi:Bromodomain adjacent to zinc finger domain like protein [Argiope bruennichi]|uniref:Bromodomain adjacent to zinc finger domain like protein n=1 Tax=Argiope bruennichi TaxID=94029 RepID=A0A8T0EVS5_ARGBR|nr:Bromodomain adjacent to zinc finger domain like protein [Argiope bruennichi]